MTERERLLNGKWRAPEGMISETQLRELFSDGVPDDWKEQAIRRCGLPSERYTLETVPNWFAWKIVKREVAL